MWIIWSFWIELRRREKVKISINFGHLVWSLIEAEQSHVPAVFLPLTRLQSHTWDCKVKRRWPAGSSSISIQRRRKKDALIMSSQSYGVTDSLHINAWVTCIPLSRTGYNLTAQLNIYPQHDEQQFAEGSWMKTHETHSCLSRVFVLRPLIIQIKDLKKITCDGWLILNLKCLWGKNVGLNILNLN